MRKFISLILAVFLISVICIPAFAAKEPYQYTRLNVIVSAEPGVSCGETKFTFLAETSDNPNMHDVTDELTIGRAQEDKSCWLEIFDKKTEGVKYDLEDPEKNIYGIYLSKDYRFVAGMKYAFRVYLENKRDLDQDGNQLASWGIWGPEKVGINGNYISDIDWGNSGSFLVSSIIMCNTGTGDTTTTTPTTTSTTTATEPESTVTTTNIVSDPTTSVTVPESTTAVRETDENSNPLPNPDTGNSVVVLTICCVLMLISGIAIITVEASGKKKAVINGEK